MVMLTFANMHSRFCDVCFWGKADMSVLSRWHGVSPQRTCVDLDQHETSRRWSHRQSSTV